MPITLTTTQTHRLGASLRRGGMDAIRIADAIDPQGRTHLFIEVSDMGQFAKDWDSLKQIIRQKDDALDRYSTQLGAMSQQVTALQQQVAGLQGQFDADDQKAAAEVRQTVAQNTPPAAQATAPTASTASVTTFTK